MGTLGIEPILPGSVQYALPGTDGWVRKALVKYNGKFWIIESYAEEATRQLAKGPAWSKMVTEAQKEARIKEAQAITWSAAARAAEDIKSGMCPVWRGNAKELRKNYWEFPHEPPEREVFD